MCCQAAIVAAGRMASPSSRARAGSVPTMPAAFHSSTAARSVSSVSSSCLRPYCGWAGVRTRQLASSISRSRPGSTTVPRGRVAITRSRARVAGMLPVEPAATIRRAGAAARHCAASSVSRRCRRSAGSRALSSARSCGQASAITASTSRLRSQCSARWSGTRLASAPNATRSVCSSSRSDASSWARRNAWIIGQPERSNSRASNSCRRSGGIAAGKVPSGALSTSTSSASISPSGWIRGNSNAWLDERRSNASASRRQARRVGNRIRASASACGALAVSASSAAASASTNGTPAGTVATPGMPSSTMKRSRRAIVNSR